MRGKQLFVSKKDHASFVDIETVIPEEDFHQDPAEDVIPDRDEMMTWSMDYDSSRLSGRICYMHFSIKKIIILIHVPPFPWRVYWLAPPIPLEVPV